MKVHNIIDGCAKNDSLKKIIEPLKSSIKFKIRLSDLIQKTKDPAIKLPYETTYIEFTDNNNNCNFSLLAKSFNNGKEIVVFMYDFTYNAFTPVAVKIIIEDEYFDFNNFYLDYTGHPTLTSKKTDIDAVSTTIISLIHDFCETLNNCNINYIETIAPEKLNKKRTKNGKLPIFSFKTLVIDKNEKVIDKSYKGGSHASPRVHLRRGHFRKYLDKKIWVSECVVGEKDKGIVHKDYLVC